MPIYCTGGFFEVCLQMVPKPEIVPGGPVLAARNVPGGPVLAARNGPGGPLLGRTDFGMTGLPAT